MNCKHWFLLGAIALASTAAFADDVPAGPATPTRSAVKKSVSDARAAGQLTVGEDASYPATRDKSSKGVKLHRKAKRTASTDPSAGASTAAK